MSNQPPQYRAQPVKGYTIFDILTRGTYATFTRAIKEAVSNSYDADAHKVEIIFAPKKFIEVKSPKDLTIQVRDDGHGMALKDFWERFASIESTKDPTKKDPSTGRFPIGQFGIGSFALVPFSLNIELYSKKYKHKPIKATMNATGLLKKSSDDYSTHVEKNVVATEIDDEVWSTASTSLDSGTVIVIKGVTSATYEELVRGTGRFKEDEKGMFTNVPFTARLKEIARELSTILPTDHSEDAGGYCKSHRKALAANNPGIAITLCDQPLERRLFSKEDSEVNTIDHKDEESGLHTRGIIVAIPDGAVTPRLANGVILRLNNVGIGGYRLFNLVGNATIRSQITGEVHMLNGLHKDLNAARNDFAGPTYDKLVAHLNDALSKLLTKAYGIWDDRNNRKRVEKRKKEEQAHRKAAEEEQRRNAEHVAATAAAATTKTTRGGEASGKDGAGGKGTNATTATATTTKSQPATRPGRQPADPAGRNGEGAKTTDPAKDSSFKDPVADVQEKTGKIRFNERARRLVPVPDAGLQPEQQRREEVSLGAARPRGPAVGRQQGLFVMEGQPTDPGGGSVHRGR